MTPNLLFEQELAGDLNAACKRMGVSGGSYLEYDLATDKVVKHELWIFSKPEETDRE